MSRHTTWRVGGSADLFIVPANRKEVTTALSILESGDIPWLVVGAGSNLLVRDGGIRGGVIHLGSLRGLSFEDGGTVRAEGGLPLMVLIRETVERGLVGIESLAGIPGTVGGGVAMNAGAGGQEIGSHLLTAVLRGAEGEEVWEKDRFEFGYRRSALPANQILTEATFRFETEDPELLKERFAGAMLKRKTAQSVGFPNAGSVFKNPPGGRAWEVITEAGLRGAVVGGAQISEKHANFIVNRGGAKAADILALVDLAKEKVRANSGIVLEPEVRIVGED